MAVQVFEKRRRLSKKIVAAFLTHFLYKKNPLALDLEHKLVTSSSGARMELIRGLK